MFLLCKREGLEGRGLEGEKKGGGEEKRREEKKRKKIIKNNKKNLIWNFSNQLKYLKMQYPMYIMGKPSTFGRKIKGKREGKRRKGKKKDQKKKRKSIIKKE